MLRDSDPKPKFWLAILAFRRLRHKIEAQMKEDACPALGRMRRSRSGCRLQSNTPGRVAALFVPQRLAINP